MTVKDIKDTADRIEDVWTEWADEVVTDAAKEAVAALRNLVAVITSDRD